MTVQITATGSPPVKAIAIGSVVDTLAGQIAPKLRTRRFPAADYSFGFEAASPKNLPSIGESVLLNNLCYATSTEEGEADYGKVIFGGEFVTGGMFLLPKAAPVTHELVLTEPMQLERLYETIYQTVKRPVAFVGTWEAETLYSTAIARAPIDGLPIFENRAYYFPKPHQTLLGKYCFVMGLLASYQDSTWEDLNKQLEAALYRNPYDGAFSLSSHTHCLILKAEVATENITPEVVEQCLHVFTDQTKLKKAHLQLYALNGVTSLD